MRHTGQINTRRWRALRDRTVRQQPTCQLQLDGCTRISTTADHIIPRSQRPDLAYEPSNVRGSCRSCNAKRGNLPLSTLKPPPALQFFNVVPHTLRQADTTDISAGQ